MAAVEQRLIEQSQPKIFSTFNFVQALIVVCIAVVSTLVSVGFFTGGLTSRVSALEESKTELKLKLDKMDEKMVDKAQYSIDQTDTKDTLKDIRDDVKELRNGRK
ncbi:MAG: hypothetical protein WA584_23475 [Pyrinomonadaceae bacterium]